MVIHLTCLIKEGSLTHWLRYHYMLLQKWCPKWLQLRDHRCLYHWQTIMQELQFAKLGMKQGARPTGLTHYNGALLACFRRLFLILGVFLLVFRGGDKSLHEGIFCLTLSMALNNYMQFLFLWRRCKNIIEVCRSYRSKYSIITKNNEHFLPIEIISNHDHANDVIGTHVKCVIVLQIVKRACVIIFYIHHF